MDSLLPQQKALLKKVFFEGIPAAEIARQEGVNKSSVHKRLQRIFEKLKKVLP
jgi:DNA-directed RNA polymerase specialized sigma24 family protein